MVGSVRLRRIEIQVVSAAQEANVPFVEDHRPLKRRAMERSTLRTVTELRIDGVCADLEDYRSAEALSPILGNKTITLL
jgi:hypothetical protein